MQFVRLFTSGLRDYPNKKAKFSIMVDHILFNDHQAYSYAWYSVLRRVSLIRISED